MGKFGEKYNLLAKCPILAFGVFYIWRIAHNYDAIVGLIVEMADSTVTFEIAIAAFVAIILSVQYGHPLSANTVNVQEIANTEDPYSVTVPNA